MQRQGHHDRAGDVPECASADGDGYVDVDILPIAGNDDFMCDAWEVLGLLRRDDNQVAHDSATLDNFGTGHSYGDGYSYLFASG